MLYSHFTQTIWHTDKLYINCHFTSSHQIIQ